MRILLSMMAALGIFIGLSIWNQNVLKDTSQELTKQLEKTKIFVAEENWNAARQEFDAEKRIWSRHKKLWLILLDHDQVDDIDNSLFRIDEMIRIKERVQCLSDIAELKFYITDIADKEYLALSNIF